MKKSKEQASCACARSKGSHRQSKSKGGEVEVRHLRGILVRSSRAQSRAAARSIQTKGEVAVRDLRGILVRSSWSQNQEVARSIQIYIANDQKPVNKKLWGSPRLTPITENAER